MHRRKKKKSLWILLLLLTAAISFFFWQFSHLFFSTTNHQPGKINTIGIPIPSGYEEFGIDVSRYQKKIDWSRVVRFQSGKFKVSFAFIKATEGKSLKDPYFDRNLLECRKHGIPCGAYHFYNPRSNAEEQANFFIQNYKYHPGDLPPVLDVEKDYPPKTLLAGVLIWLKKVESHYKIKPIIYCNSAYYESYFSGTEIDLYPLWLAHYRTGEPRISRNWSYWQWSDQANIDGIEGNVDVNVKK